MNILRKLYRNNIKPRISNKLHRKLADIYCLCVSSRGLFNQLSLTRGRGKSSSFKFPEPFHLHYNPDSFQDFNFYPEARELFIKFIQGNERYNAGDFCRFYAFILHMSRLNELKIPGGFAELGVYKGNSAVVMAHYAARKKRRVYLFDTFKGFDKRDLSGADAHIEPAFSDTDLESVKEFVGYPETCRYYAGFFPESVPARLKNKKFAFVHIDCDLHDPMKAGLEFFYPRMSPGGYMFLHDYSSGHWRGCRRAIDDFCSRRKLSLFLLPDKSGTAVISIPY